MNAEALLPLPSFFSLTIWLLISKCRSAPTPCPVLPYPRYPYDVVTFAPLATQVDSIRSLLRSNDEVRLLYEIIATPAGANMSPSTAPSSEAAYAGMAPAGGRKARAAAEGSDPSALRSVLELMLLQPSLRPKEGETDLGENVGYVGKGTSLGPTGLVQHARGAGDPPPLQPHRLTIAIEPDVAPTAMQWQAASGGAPSGAGGGLPSAGSAGEHPWKWRLEGQQASGSRSGQRMIGGSGSGIDQTAESALPSSTVGGMQAAGPAAAVRKAGGGHAAAAAAAATASASIRGRLEGSSSATSSAPAGDLGVERAAASSPLLHSGDISATATGVDNAVATPDTPLPVVALKGAGAGDEPKVEAATSPEAPIRTLTCGPMAVTMPLLQSSMAMNENLEVDANKVCAEIREGYPASRLLQDPTAWELWWQSGLHPRFHFHSSSLCHSTTESGESASSPSPMAACQGKVLGAHPQGPGL